MSFNLLDYKYKFNTRYPRAFNSYTKFHGNSELNTTFESPSPIYLNTYGVNDIVGHRITPDAFSRSTYMNNRESFSLTKKKKINRFSTMHFGGDAYSDKTYYQEFNTEAYSDPKSVYTPVMLNNIKQVINSRALALVWFLNNTPIFRAFKYNWDLLQKNMNKGSICLLNKKDRDVGYTIGKNAETKVKIFNGSRIVPLSILSHIVIHEMCHMSVEYTDHPEEFFDLLSVMIFAGAELRYFDPDQIPSNYFEVYGQKTVSKESIRRELNRGINYIIQCTPDLSVEEHSFLNDWSVFINSRYA